MPELPEVETVRRGLSELYVGRALQRVVVTGRRTVRRHPAAALASLEGRKLLGVGRHGKYLLLQWGERKQRKGNPGPGPGRPGLLVVHLRMSGQLLAAQAGAPKPAHTHAVLCFSEGRDVYFVDPRTFGELFIACPALPVPTAAGLGRPLPSDLLPSELHHLGPDALRAEARYLRQALAGKRAPLKSVLVDQRVLAGVGNIYADEICFSAKLRPDRAGGTLRPRELARLAASTRSVLEAAIAARGSTLVDQRYRDLMGNGGLYQLQHKVYGRAGQACLSCGAEVQRLTLGAKKAYFCPRCQR
ncbi:MAG: bifunctional DNA-formamidopyrimidine glycosylase/DNA-(apurinic or apyrimidinic site) lyase [Acidimicrobiales bacterium]